MNSRKPIFVMMLIGIIVILTLTFTPYALLSRARQAVSAVIQPMPDSPEAVEIQKPQEPPPPPFDVLSWYAEREVDPAKHAILIESIGSGHVFAAHQADEKFNPASLIKLTTSLTVLHRLGKDFRFETRVFTDGTVDAAGVLHGTLYIAGGDPTFGDIAANMIARKLEEQGIKRVPDELVVTPDFCFNFSEKPEDSADRMARVMKIAPKKRSVGEAPAGTPRFVLKSYPLHEVLLYMNAHSSNFVAHRLGNLVGGPDGVRSFLVDELHLPPDKVFLSTTSGLEHNEMTPRGLLAVIRALNEEAGRQGLKLEDIMPVASGDWGTLRRRLEGTPLEGAAVGKTGTLVHDDGGMSSIGGIVYTQNAGMVGFVILNQGSGIGDNKKLSDDLLVQVILSQDTPVEVQRPEQRRHLLEQSDLIIEE